MSRTWRRIVKSADVFVIAEIGVNHNGRLATAKKLIDAAKRAGADAVKFQTFDAGRLACAGAPKAAYQKKGAAKESQQAMLRRLQLSQKDHYDLLAYCRRKKILFLSTPFDEQCADFLNQLGVEFFKIPSGEITNWPYLRHIGRLGKPVVLSTGMADLKEVREAVGVIKKTGNARLALLHCVSNYPACPQDVNLRAMPTLAGTFNLPVGYSDHTVGIDIASAAVALGAAIIEKHLTLDKNLPGPDHRMSLEPDEFKAMVQSIRRVRSALGNGVKVPAKSEAQVAAVARKSLVAARSIRKKEKITAAMVAVKRPGTGLPPKYLPRVVGRTAARNIAADELIHWSMLK